MKYSINGKIAELKISGKTIFGENLCLLDCDDDLSKNCFWQNEGFVVAKMFNSEVFEALYRGVVRLIREALIKAGCVVKGDDFFLDRYHTYCPDQKTHQDVIYFLRNKACIYNLPINHRILDERVSELCGKTVSCSVGDQIASGYFFIRIVRPLPYHDNNPPHKDAWLGHLRNGLNLYLPLAGSDQNSSLSLVSGSHLWNEIEIPRAELGSTVNGFKYSVQSVVMRDLCLKMSRPIVKECEGMLFSPYLIHGGAVNFNTDRTRVSLEMRFWRLGK